MIAEVAASDFSFAAQIHALAQAAYRLEAAWIACADFPPLRESLEELRQSSDRFLVFQELGGVVGALSFDDRADPVVITRLVASPTRLRRGIATTLLADLERRLPSQTRLTVSTAATNTAAVALYHRRGFGIWKNTVSPEAIPLVHFHKRIERID